MTEKKRDYKKEYRDYHSKPEQIANRSDRNQARRKVEDKLGHKLRSDQDVDHKTPIKNGGSNNTSNLRVVDESRNSGWRKGQKGYKVGKV